MFTITCSHFFNNESSRADDWNIGLLQMWAHLNWSWEKVPGNTRWNIPFLECLLQKNYFKEHAGTTDSIRSRSGAPCMLTTVEHIRYARIQQVQHHSLFCALVLLSVEGEVWRLQIAPNYWPESRQLYIVHVAKTQLCCCSVNTKTGFCIWLSSANKFMSFLINPVYFWI